jgi:pimeloyl-ACP methyl ester carboxylesterase
LQVLSEVRSDGVGGNPMGPWEEGIINKKLARQLRKWLVRAGKKTDADFKAWKKLPHGIITYIGGVGTRVEWQDESIAEGQTKAAGYYQTGENDYWELVDFSEAETGPAPGMFDEENVMHTGGSVLLQTKTFVVYFAPRFCAFLWYWIIFFAYFGMLYVFEYSLASYSVYQAMGNAFPRRGKQYNIQPGNNYKIHVFCKGGTKKEWDGRPPVLMEAMEGLGSGIYLSRLQDQIAEYGVCCVYDRLGFGYSSDSEASGVWNDRSPKQIAKELRYALTVGVDDTLNQNPLSFEKPYIGVKGENLTQYIRVEPPFVVLAHSAGALYARQFAHDYPELVAGMVLVDPLPAEMVCNKKDGDQWVLSQQQKILNPFIMQLCQRFLQPMGLVYNFYPILAASLFDTEGPAIEFQLNGKWDKPYNDFQVMMSRMYERQWCPSVLAEYTSLYDKNGIASVIEADKKGYDMPTVIWVRDASRLEDTYSYDKVYKEECGNSAAVTVRKTVTKAVTAPCSKNFQGNSSSDTVPQRRSGCRDCNLSWDDLMRRLLKSFRGALMDPFTGKVDIMKGDRDSCVNEVILVDVDLHLL